MRGIDVNSATPRQLEQYFISNPLPEVEDFFDSSDRRKIRELIADIERDIENDVDTDFSRARESLNGFYLMMRKAQESGVKVNDLNERMKTEGERDGMKAGLKLTASSKSTRAAARKSSKGHRFEYSVDDGFEVFDWRGRNISVSAITGACYIVYGGHIYIEPLFIVDTGEVFVDAESDKMQMRVVELALFTIIPQNLDLINKVSDYHFNDPEDWEDYNENNSWNVDIGLAHPVKWLSSDMKFLKFTFMDEIAEAAEFVATGDSAGVQRIILGFLHRLLDEWESVYPDSFADDIETMQNLLVNLSDMTGDEFSNYVGKIRQQLEKMLAGRS